MNQQQIAAKQLIARAKAQVQANLCVSLRLRVSIFIARVQTTTAN
jgi:hypothetical protein